MKINLKSKFPKPNRGKVIVWGLLSSLPFGGMVWQVLHHIVGFRRLGFDVWYVEDSDRNVLDPNTWMPTTDYKENIQFIADMMSSVGLEDKWVFREPCEPQICHGGKDFDGLLDLYKECDAVFNLCIGQELLPYHEIIKCLVCLETDPGVFQISVAKGHEGLIKSLERYDYIFSYGQNLGEKDCILPAERFNWIPTVPPVITDWWQSDMLPKNCKFTTIANWDTKDIEGVEWEGDTYYWQKGFKRFIDLPKKSKIPIELALVGIDDENKRTIKNHRWLISSAKDLSDFYNYHDYICSSLGEFTVTKDQYVRMKSGWFSDRSVCYLAAGRPVITEETGFSKFIPTGEGLFSFSTEEEILVAIDAIYSNYQKQSQRAREIANEYFRSEGVLYEILKAIRLF
jgi:hypothetical protein